MPYNLENTGGSFFMAVLFWKMFTTTNTFLKAVGLVGDLGGGAHDFHSGPLYRLLIYIDSGGFRISWRGGGSPSKRWCLGPSFARYN